ncbi:hypothetical protein BC567DRAFT_234507 [Phyllosticta citribraziliensis]
MVRGKVPVLAFWVMANSRDTPNVVAARFCEQHFGHVKSREAIGSVRAEEKHVAFWRKHGSGRVARLIQLTAGGRGWLHA